MAKKNNKKGEKKSVEVTKKQELNNLIVLMRNSVSKAKTQVLNKLIREVKKLNLRKGDKKEKAERKAKRYLEEINIIKHLKNDKVSIYALKTKRTLTEVLSNPRFSLEAKAYAKLANNKLVQSQVLNYRENNPNWELQIPILLVRGKDRRKAADIKIREASEIGEKEGPLLPSNRNKLIEALINTKPTEEEEDFIVGDEEEEEISGDELEPPQDDFGSENEVEEEGEESDNIESEEPEEEEDLVEDKASDKSEEEEEEEVKTTIKDKRLKKKKKLEEEPEEKLIKEDKSITEASETILKKKNKTIKTSYSKIIPEKINKTDGALKIQFLKSLDDLEETEERVKGESIEFSSLPVKKKPGSSFFVGGEDKVVLEDNPEEKRPVKKEFVNYNNFNRNNNNNRNQDYKPTFKKGKIFNKFQQKQQPPRKFSNSNLTPLSGPTRYFNTEDKQYNNIERKEPNNNNNNTNFNNNRDRNNLKNNKTEPINANNKVIENLHPSWAAKKRQTISLDSFQGKKIKFSDD